MDGVFALVFPLSDFCSPSRIGTSYFLFFYSAFYQPYANEKRDNLGHWGSFFFFHLPLFTLTLQSAGFFFHLPYILSPGLHSLIFPTRVKIFSFFFFVFQTLCKQHAGIIYTATGIHLGETLPRAVHHPPSYLCVPKSFLSMQLECEIAATSLSHSLCLFSLLSFLWCSSLWSNHAVVLPIICLKKVPIYG